MKWLSGWIFPHSNPFPRWEVVVFLMRLDKIKLLPFLKLVQVFMRVNQQK